MLYIGSTLVGNATHVVANVLTCNTLSPINLASLHYQPAGLTWWVLHGSNIHKTTAARQTVLCVNKLKQIGWLTAAMCMHDNVGNCTAAAAAGPFRSQSINRMRSRGSRTT